MIHYETNHFAFTSWSGTNMNFIPHIHQEIEIIYIKKGSMSVILQHTTFTIHASDFVLIMPHTLHEYKTPKSCEYIALIFKPDLIAHYQSIMTQHCTYPIIRGPNLHSDIPSYLEYLLLDDTKSEIGLLKGYLYLLFTRLLPGLNFVKATHSSHQNLICNCLEYIHLHFKEPLSLDHVATHLGVSPYYVSRIFNKSIGYSFTYYINTLRIDYAKYLLYTTTLTVTEISFECGYETIRHFNRVFKDFTGLSPHNYQLSLN